MQIKTALRFHLISVMMVMINKTPDNKSWQGCGERRALTSHYVAQDIFEASSLPYLSKCLDYIYVYRTFKLLSKAAPNLFPLNQHNYTKYIQVSLWHLQLMHNTYLDHIHPPSTFSCTPFTFF